MDPKQLHAARGIGLGSRIELDIHKLQQHGWTVITRTYESRDGKTKTCYSYKNPNGKSFAGSKAVEAELLATGLYDAVLKDSVIARNESMNEPNESSSSNLSDMGDFNVQPSKKAKTTQQLESVKVDEALFLTTISSVEEFVEKFNTYFQCPSDKGKCQGKLFLTSTERHLGIGMKLSFKCNGCLTFKSLDTELEPRLQNQD